jgi:hypothetical protein
MISIECKVSVPGFPHKEIGYWTLVRAYENKFQFNMTNDGMGPLRGLNVRPVLESYAGQEKPLLFQWGDTKVIEVIPPKGIVPIESEFWPIFPGLVSVGLYVTDAANKAVMAKRKTDAGYAEAPVRWWFHVADDISLETLRTLRKLLARREETKK